MSSGLTSLDEAKRYGFIGICEVGAWNQQACDAWMKQNAAGGEDDGDHNAAVLSRVCQGCDRMERIHRPSGQS